jgi:hypothetical protein
VQRIEHQLARCALWPERFPAEQWTLYKRVMKNARERGVKFAIGGALASTTYSGQWRNTKDIDLYIKRSDREKMVEVLSDAGLADYYDQKPYDRNWIYRSCRDDLIVDVMWAMANQRAQVDDLWLQGPEVEVEGERFRLLPPEETLWSKLYVVQRDRCDWPDALSLLSAVGAEIEWQHLLERLGEDAPLLSALLTVFEWIYPEGARELPIGLRDQLAHTRLVARDISDASSMERARLLDSRPWFPPANEDGGDRQ